MSLVANNGGRLSGLATDLLNIGLDYGRDYLQKRTDKATGEADKVKNTKTEVPKSEAAQQQPDNTMRYVLIGVGGLAALGLVVWAVSRNKGGS